MSLFVFVALVFLVGGSVGGVGGGGPGEDDGRERVVVVVVVADGHGCGGLSGGAEGDGVPRVILWYTCERRRWDGKETKRGEEMGRGRSAPTLASSAPEMGPQSEGRRGRGRLTCGYNNVRGEKAVSKCMDARERRTAKREKEDD